MLLMQILFSESFVFICLLFKLSTTYFIYLIFPLNCLLRFYTYFQFELGQMINYLYEAVR